MRRNRLNAVYGIVLGAFMLIAWTMIIIQQGIPNLRSEVIAFIFHWSAEFATAALLIIAGAAIIKKTRRYEAVFYLALGMVINAAQGAFWFYIMNFSPLFIILMLIVTASAVWLAVTNYSGGHNLTSLTAGVGIYGVVNLVGNALNRGNWDVVIYSVPILISVILLLSVTPREH